MSYYYYLWLIQNARTSAQCIDILRQAALVPTITRQDFAKLYQATTEKERELRKVPAHLR